MDMEDNPPKRILIVEDSKDVQALLAHLLKSEGYHVDCVMNGREAIDFLGSTKNLPGLILLDLMMPVMDGQQFRLEQAKNPKIASIPVIVMTANGEVQTRSLQIGNPGFLKKPFLDIPTILETVGRFFPN